MCTVDLRPWGTCVLLAGSVGCGAHATVRAVVANPRPAPVAPTATGPTLGRAEWFRAVGAVLVRPDLWWTVARQWARLTPERWWRDPPHLPVPPRSYLAFRMETAYGRGGRPRAADVVEYLEWCRRANPSRSGAAHR